MSPADLHIANSLRLALSDLRDARALRLTNGRSAAYLAQQAVEKLVLALLISENIERTRAESHRLDVLIDKLPTDHPLVMRLKSLAYLTAYATTFRYPREGGRLPPEPDWAKIDGSLALTAELIGEAARHFGVDLEASDRIPATNVVPMREGRSGQDP